MRRNETSISSNRYRINERILSKHSSEVSELLRCLQSSHWSLHSHEFESSLVHSSKKRCLDKPWCNRDYSDPISPQISGHWHHHAHDSCFACGVSNKIFVPLDT